MQSEGRVHSLVSGELPNLNHITTISLSFPFYSTCIISYIFYEDYTRESLLAKNIMNTSSLHRFFASLVRLFGIWYVAEDTLPLRIVEIALKKWKHPAIALRKLSALNDLRPNTIYALCLLWSKIKGDDPFSSPQTLQKYLERLPLQRQPEALSLTTHGDDTRTALLLTQFSTPVPQGLSSLAQSLMTQWMATRRCDDLALRFYQSLPAYGMPQMEHLWLLMQVYEVRHQFIEAEQQLLQLVQVQPSSEAWWHLVFISQELHYSSLARLETLVHFIECDRNDGRVEQALSMVEEIIPALLNDRAAMESLSVSLKTLRALFMLFPPHERAVLLTRLARNHEALMASLLIFFASPIIPGLQPVAQTIMMRWEELPRHDALAMRFYATLVEYGIATEKVALLYAQAFIAKGMLEQAEQLLQRLPELQTFPDALWLLISIQQQLHRSSQVQLETLQRFIASTPSTPSDSRVAQAWVMIGDVYGNDLEDGIASVRAYERAEALGMAVPQLVNFRMGNWDSIPALRTHPDYAFPVTVAVDLESDLSSKAKPGELVFEVAAVRTKGRTTLLDYHSYIRRSFKPAKLQNNDVIEQAPELAQVVTSLQTFLGNAFVVGHNLRAFDAKELQGMGVIIAKERLIDTLVFARCLYPDRLRHNLALLCKPFDIQASHGEWHTALQDAYACGQLLYALGDELLHRGETLLKGVRALTPPGSAFDCAVLQPRAVAANPALPWLFDARPSLPHLLTDARRLSASVEMQKALRERRDILLDLYDAEGAYVVHLPVHQRSVVTVDASTRIEGILAALTSHNDTYVLPDPQTLLCPQRLRTIIEQEIDGEYRVLLFCLYQASHNHDARTLYPFRFHSDDEPELLKLRRDLMRSCCSSLAAHHPSCLAKQAHLEAVRDHRMLLATHEAFVHQEQAVQAQLIVIDDIAELQMHLAEYRARKVSSEWIDALQVTPAEQDALTQLRTQIVACVQAYAPQPNFHERLPLRSLIRFLREMTVGTQSSMLSVLKGAGNTTRELAEIIDLLCTEALHEPAFYASHNVDGTAVEGDFSNRLHVYWLDVWFSDTNNERAIERWAINGLDEDLAKFFTTRFWQPYQQHILCGTALNVDTRSATFLERTLNIPPGLPILKDARPTARVYVPDTKMLAAPGFLHRYSWAMQVGSLLHTLSMQSSEHKILVTLNQKALSASLADAFYQTRSQAKRQTLSTTLGWSLTKMKDRLHDSERNVLALLSPRARRTQLDVPVDIEVSGPLQFLNQNDPLVAAQMKFFHQRYPQETPFQSYLLPQAMLELKARLSTDAKLHIVLDSRLYMKSYRDEVFEVLGQVAHVEKQVDALVMSVQIREVQKTFLSLLTQQLEQHGFNVHDAVSDEELLVALRRFWDTDDFRTFETTGTLGKTLVSQKQVVRDVLEGKDQLLVAATGGGKSLCFQLPALLLAEDTVPKVTVIFSPLISLMSDQVAALQQKGVFSAIVLNSTLSSIQKQEYLKGLAQGDYSIVYVAPEQIRSSAFRRALEQREISFIAVDEAHCLSQWGHDFRTDYFVVKDWIEQFSHTSGQRTFPILALTATARKGHISSSLQEDSDQTSTIEDIIKQLKLRIKEEQAIIISLERRELEFRVEQIETPPCTCGGIITFKNGKAVCQKCQKKYDEKEKIERLKFARLAYLLNDRGASGLRQRWDQPSGKQQRGLIYCAYATTIPVVADYLKKHIPDLRVGMYYGALEAEEKERVLQGFKSDVANRLDVVIATNAFGMGIDVRRLGFVIHFDVPGTLEAYYQEAGRAGRDAMFRNSTEKAVCILLYHPTDLEKPRYLSRKNTITANQVKDVYDVLCELWRDIGKNVTQDNSREIITTEQDLAMRAGVSEEQIGMILYYLENHATLHGAKVLKRGETVSNILKLKFENGYEQYSESLPKNSPSRPLLTCFQQDDTFKLQEETSTDIPMRELATKLRWSPSKLEQELLNLVRRNIVSYVCQGRIKWTANTRDAVSAREILRHVRDQIWEVFRKMHKKHPKVFIHGEQVFEELTPVYLGLQLKTIPQQQLFHFLSALSHSTAGTLRLFERFTRVTRGKNPGNYMVRLLTADQDTLIEKIKYIFQELDDVVTNLEQQRVTDELQPFDLLQFALNYPQRQAFHKKLLLLDVLGLVKYSSDPYTGLGMRIFFQQPYVLGKELVIDLSSLRLKELYETRKLKLMEEYAVNISDEERAKAFNTYFYGEKPLLASASQYARTDLTEQQQELLKRDNGIHLIEGPAGSGKTTVLLEYIKHLVHSKHVPLDHILIMTHYRSATNRIADVAGVFQEEYGDLQIRTLNSFGEMIFRKYRTCLVRSDGKPYYKDDSEDDLKVLSSEKVREKQQQQIVNKALRNIFSPHWQNAFLPKDLKLPERGEPYQSNDNEEKLCLESIRRLREYGLFPSEKTTKEQIMDALGKWRNNPVMLSLHYAVYLEFLQLMGQAKCYTFDDQVLFALSILRSHPELAKDYQDFYEYVIVDELQDFTRAQAELLLLLSEKQKNLVTFGDRDQEIRVKERREEGAPSIFNIFAEKESCGEKQVHQLTTNFRSTQRILDLVSYVRNYQEPRKRPSLKSNHSGYGEYPVLLHVDKAPLQSGQQSMGVETQLVQMMTQASLDQIQQISASERGSIALIAARANWSFTIELYLRERRQDFRVMKNDHLYQLHHINRVLVYLRLIVDNTKDDDVAFWLRSSMVPYFDEQQVKMLQELSLQSGHRLFEILKDTSILTKIQVMPEQRQALEKHLSILTCFDQHSLVCNVIDTLRAIEDGPITVLNEDEQKKEDIEKVATRFSSYTVRKAVEEIQQHISYLKDSQKHAGLTLATIDNAKSEEFDTVFLLGAHLLKNKSNTQVSLSDKRRMYVSLSRAKRRLFLVMNENGVQGNELLASIPKHLYEEQIWMSDCFDSLNPSLLLDFA